jgi:peptidoglycan hydrolase-like protein with peptidoglycan-binding domain
LLSTSYINIISQGTLKIDTTTADRAVPVAGANYTIKDKNGRILFQGTTNANGESGVYTLDTLPASLSLSPAPNTFPYAVYDVTIQKQGFATIHYIDVEIFDGQEAILPVDMIPLTSPTDQPEYTIIIPPPTVALPTPPQLQVGSEEIVNEGNTPLARVLPEVIVPEHITVHLGTPGNTAAPNTRVRFIDYVKNVTCSEIYSTWPVNSIIANVHSIVTFALNRIYTEWYRARGFNFDITNSTTVDQAFIPNRQIFQNISQIVDGIFNVYARRQGFRNPFFTQYCSGTTATCRGLSQWGTVSLANRGFTPLQILHYYFPNDLILSTAPSGTIVTSYPGQSFTLGSSGPNVLTIQNQLNRIRANFPLIPQITNPNGEFGQDTLVAVRTFQRVFNLVQDGVVGRSTWNKISQVFTSVTRLAELNSEGERIGLSPTPPTVVIREGARGENVTHAQFLLRYIAQFYNDIPAPIIDNIFGPRTTDAVRAFQRRFGLTADGIVGPNTWRRLYEVFRQVQGQVPQPPIIQPPTPPTPPTIRPPYPGFLLRRGSTGEAVRTLQTLLNENRKYHPILPLLAVDGIFGPITEGAVRTFQSREQIAVDGIVGPITWGRLTARL